MKNIIIIVLSLIGMLSISRADSYVNGYTRSNGTYVAPHYRSNRDNSIGNNWSTRGNTNPYNGLKGYRTFY